MVKLGMDDIAFNGTSGIKTDAFIEGVGGADVADGVIAFLDGPPMEDLPGGVDFQTAYDAADFTKSPRGLRRIRLRSWHGCHHPTLSMI